MLFFWTQKCHGQAASKGAADARHQDAKKDTTFIVSCKQQYSRKVTLGGIPNNTDVFPLFSRMPAIQF